jgi:hypothetical protein
MKNKICKNEIETAFDNLCEQFSYATDRAYFDSFIFVFQEHYIVFYELLHTPNISSITTLEQVNDLCYSLTSKQQTILNFINEQKSYGELESLLLKLEKYINQFYNLLDSNIKIELQEQIKGLGENLDQKMKLIKFLEFESIAKEIETKHQSLLHHMNKDNDFVKRNINTNKFEISFPKSTKGKKKR